MPMKCHASWYSGVVKERVSREGSVVKGACIHPVGDVSSKECLSSWGGNLVPVSDPSEMQRKV